MGCANKALEAESERLMATAGVPVESELSGNSGQLPGGFTILEEELPDSERELSNAYKLPKSILQEADEIAGESRSRDYGHPFENHRRIAAMWNIIAEKYIKQPLTPRIVALMMIGLKQAREVNSKSRDNLVDMAGYVKCVDMIDEHIEKASNGV
jgi:hypothetical protein